MPIRAGALDKRIAFVRESIAGKTALGTRTTAETVLGGRWAKVFYGTGSEKRAAAAEGAAQTATFMTRRDGLTRTISVTDAIRFDGADWDITAAHDSGEDAREFTATRRAG